MSVESNPGLHWFCFTLLCEWSRKLAPPSKPIRYKTKTNRDLVTRVFPRLRPVTCVYFDFSLAPSDIFVCSNWPLGLLWFWFYDTQSKSALLWKVDISWWQLCHQQLCTRWWRLFKLDTYGVASRSPFPPWHCLMLACVTNKTKSRIMHAAILPVAIPPLVHPAGICNIFLSWRSIPHSQACRKRQFPTPELLINHIYIFCYIRWCIQKEIDLFSQLLWTFSLREG